MLLSILIPFPWATAGPSSCPTLHSSFHWTINDKFLRHRCNTGITIWEIIIYRKIQRVATPVFLLLRNLHWPLAASQLIWQRNDKCSSVEERIACKIIAELQGIDPWWWYRNQLLFRVGVAFHSCEEIATLLTVARCIHHPENSVHSEEGLFRRGPVSGNFSN